MPFPGAATGWRPAFPLPVGKGGCFGVGVPDVLGVVSIASSESLDTEGTRSSWVPEGVALFGGTLSVGARTAGTAGAAVDSTREPTWGTLVGFGALASTAGAF